MVDEWALMSFWFKKNEVFRWRFRPLRTPTLPARSFFIAGAIRPIRRGTGSSIALASRLVAEMRDSRKWAPVRPTDVPLRTAYRLINHSDYVSYVPSLHEWLSSRGDWKRAIPSGCLASISYASLVVWYSAQSPDIQITGSYWTSFGLAALFAFGTVVEPVVAV